MKRQRTMSNPLNTGDGFGALHQGMYMMNPLRGDGLDDKQEMMGVRLEDIRGDVHPPAPTAELSGGRVNYYLIRVDHPQRETQAPYTAECEDLIDAAGMTPDEANIFKEIWRSANARKGKAKLGHNAVYGAEKMVHYAQRLLAKRKREANSGL